MRASANLEKLKSSDVVEVSMDEKRILQIWFNHPMLDADMDYRVARYASKKQKELEKIHGECIGVLMDINRYRRLDQEDFFGVFLPSAKVRRINYDLFSESELKRIAICKKEAPRVVQACANIVLFTQGKKVKVFNDRKKALAWLEEGVKEYFDAK